MATTNKLVVGKGRAYIALYVNDVLQADERYIGNSPSFSITSSGTSLDHTSSEGGIAVTDASVLIAMKRSAKFQTDNIDVDNVALTFNTTPTVVAQTTATGVTETITMKAGMRYQLGVSAALPQGIRDVTNVVITDGATPVDNSNFTIDLKRASIIVNTDNAAGITSAGKSLTVTYNKVASSRKVAVAANQSVYAAIRFVSDNPYGENKDFYMPFVKIAPSGSYELIGDKFQVMDFDIELLQRNSATAAIYIDGQPYSA